MLQVTFSWLTYKIQQVFMYFGGFIEVDILSIQILTTRWRQNATYGFALCLNAS